MALIPFAREPQLGIARHLLTTSSTMQVSLIAAAATTAALSVWLPIRLLGTDAATPAALQEPVANVASSNRTPVSPLTIEDEHRWETTLTQSLSLSGVKALHATVGAGDIQVVPGTGDALELEAQIVADTRRVAPEALTNNFDDHVLVERNEGKLVLRDAHAAAENQEERQGWGVTLILRTPIALPTDAISGAGSITVMKAKGDVSLITGAGSATVHMPEQELASFKAEVGAGDVRCDVAQVQGSLQAMVGAGNAELRLHNHSSGAKVKLEVGAGSVSLSMPQNVSGAFDLRTVAGQIRVPDSLGLEVKRGTAGESAKGQVGASECSYSASTSSGDIEIKFE